MTARHVVGIDLGGTKVRAGIATETGELLAELREPTAVRDGRPVAEQLVELVERLAATAGVPYPDAVAVGGAGAAETGGVTFHNASNHHVDLYVRYGGSSCIDAATAQKVSVDAGQSTSVASGDAKVCYCLSVPERATCPGGWLQAAAGSTQRLQ